VPVGAALVGHGRHIAAARHALRAGSKGGAGTVASLLHGILGSLGGISGSLGGISGLLAGARLSSLAGLPAAVAQAVSLRLFSQLGTWLGGGAVYVLEGLGHVMSASTSPPIGTSFFAREIGVMALIGAAVALPLLLLTAIQSVVQQDSGLLIRTVLVKVPLALVLTGVAVQLVALGLAATDAMCGAMLQTARVPSGQLFSGIARAVAAVTLGTGSSAGAFAACATALVVALVALLLWLELALRSAAIEAAVLFLPLALAGVIWPATSHWARRLGETLAALVLSKLVIVAILALAAGQLAGAGGGGFAEVVSGMALLLLAALAPFALLRLVPVVEAGAIAHLEGLARRPAYAARSLALEGATSASELSVQSAAAGCTAGHTMTVTDGESGGGGGAPPTTLHDLARHLETQAAMVGSLAPTGSGNGPEGTGEPAEELGHAG
jgi:hypothetical protein